MLRTTLICGTALAALATSSQAVTVTGIAAEDGTDLVSTLLGTSSGLTVVAGSEAYVGADDQGGTYNDFGTIGLGSLADGVVLSTGYATGFPDSNTDGSFDHTDLGFGSPQGQPGGSSDDADLAAILDAAGLASEVNDVNTLSFSFTVDDPEQNSVEANFVFGTEEFPDQAVTDIFAFIVDGVNYAAFSDGSLINFDLGSPSAGFYNDNTNGDFAIEFDGLTDILKVTGLLDTSLTEHTIKVAIADTSDNIFDSAVAIANLSGTTSSGTGGITDGNDNDVPPVPLPATALLMLGALGLLPIARSRRG